MIVYHLINSALCGQGLIQLIKFYEYAKNTENINEFPNVSCMPVYHIMIVIRLPCMHEELSYCPPIQLQRFSSFSK